MKRRKGIKAQEAEAHAQEEKTGVIFARCLIDCARLPLYGAALMSVHLAAMVLGLFSAHVLYDSRKIAGNLEKAMNRGQEGKGMLHTLAPCFLPKTNLSEVLELSWRRKEGEEDWVEGLEGFAMRQLCYRRKHRALFNDCFALLKADRAYRSAALAKR
jgi:hypothetical protein